MEHLLTPEMLSQAGGFVVLGWFILRRLERIESKQDSAHRIAQAARDEASDAADGIAHLDRRFRRHVKEDRRRFRQLHRGMRRAAA